VSPRPPSSPVIRILRPLASLRLTVGLLGFAIILIVVATLDQTNLGIRGSVEQYFRTFIAQWDYQTPAHFDKSLGHDVPPTTVFSLYFPGGYILGGLMLLNLAAAHTVRFSPSWRKVGIVFIHTGIVLLLVGELFTGLFSREMNMTIDEGQTLNYAEDTVEVELALVDVTDPTHEKHVAIPESRLEKDTQIAPPELPFRVEILEFIPNARLREIGNPAEGFAPTSADKGIGPGALLARLPEARSMDERNLPAVIFRLHDGSRTLGTWIGSLILARPQRVQSADGRVWNMNLRPRRTYFPFSITLQDFQHKKYPGTDISRDFSSYVTLTTPEMRDGRDVRIWMNHPLRHGGYTFYQHQFLNQDKTSGLLVVANPAWILPYVSSTLVTIGLLVHFIISLSRFADRKSQQTPHPRAPQTA